MGASFRSAWGGDGGDGGKPMSRGLPPAAFWGTGRRGKVRPVPQKGIPKGLVPWAGAGRARRSPRGMVAKTRRPREERAVFAAREAPIAPSPPCSGRVCQPLKDACEYAKRFFPVLPARLPALPERQTAPQRTFPRKPAKTRRATQQRLCPTGANSVASAPPQRPLPGRARQRRPTRAVPARHPSSTSAASARPALPSTPAGVILHTRRQSDKSAAAHNG